MEKSDDIKDLLAALSKAQATMKPAVKDKKNPYYESKYASPESVQEATKESLAQNGLSVIQLIEECNGTHLRTILGHSSGQWIASSFKLLITKLDMQGAGSAITYARRYAVSAILNVASDEDDDANLAADVPITKSQPTKLNPPAQPRNFAPTTTHDPKFYDESDLKRELENYKIPFGKKYIGRTLLEVGYHESKKYLDYLLGESKKSGKSPSESIIKLKEMIQLYENYMAEQKAPSDIPRFDMGEPWPDQPI